jgi:hypothetical protein
MRDELERVLTYPHIVLRHYAQGRVGGGKMCWRSLIGLRGWCLWRIGRPYVCKDLDDQKFIDLACVYSCWLVSKDKAVLTMRNRLGAHLAFLLFLGLLFRFLISSLKLFIWFHWSSWLQWLRRESEWVSQSAHRVAARQKSPDCLTHFTLALGVRAISFSCGTLLTRLQFLSVILLG